jgi:putative transposase
MHRDLVDDGHAIGRHRTARLMRQNGLVRDRSAASSARRTANTLGLSHPICRPGLRRGEDLTANGADERKAREMS